MHLLSIPQQRFGSTNVAFKYSFGIDDSENIILFIFILNRVVSDYGRDSVNEPLTVDLENAFSTCSTPILRKQMKQILPELQSLVSYC